MAFYSIKQVFEEMAKNYELTRAKLIETWDKIEQLEAKKHDVARDKRFTEGARTAELYKVNNEIWQERERLENIRAESERQYAAIMKDASASVGKRYRPSASTLDQKAVALFDSGILSVSEMLSFVVDNEISDISTRRTIGKHMAAFEENNRIALTDEQALKLRVAAYELQQSTDAFSDNMDGLYSIFSAGTRTDRLLADGVNDSLVNQTYQERMEFAQHEDIQYAAQQAAAAVPSVLNG